jgi:hypothetical protein
MLPHLLNKVVFIIALVAILTLTMNPHPASACSCVILETPAESFEPATAVFSGRVIAREEPTGSTIRSDDPVTITFQVYEVWKGPEQSVIEITTALTGPSCGYEFAVDQSYLVYAYGEEDDLQVSLCSRTNILASANEDIATLGESKASFCQDDSEDTSNQAPDIATADENNGFNYVAVITFIAGILAGLLGYAFFTRRRIAAKK